MSKPDLKNIKYFSTFTGIGGLDMGLEEAGMTCVGFSEIRQSSIEIYKKHYPEHKNYGDITEIDPKELPDFDIFTGGFPCQTFSLSGLQKGFRDKRGRMIFTIYDILVEKQPKYLILENVKGIAMHNGGKTIESVLQLLKEAGYWVRIVLLNSSHYGSAQGRERVLFLGRLNEDFPEKHPVIVDDKKRFRDIRAPFNQNDKLSEKVMNRLRRTIRDREKGFELIGGYDRVNTITTGVSSSGRVTLVTQEPTGEFRRLSALEAERLQCFSEGWTESATNADRWFALGNAVNCNVSRYLVNDYLKGLWW